MCRNILWCYILVLTLLDISLNTKSTAHGESHGVSIHDSLVEGITFQEWGKESVVEGIGLDGEGDVVEGVSLEPRALQFGRAALAAPHSRTVTLTNTANTTLHLASVAGTTPDFHASFFESKTLPPQGNTTFSVVYLGRREGPVSAHLYIHTSLGVHKYPVSAVGEASAYGLWPLVGVRVPLNASVEPELRLHNPTDATVQVREVYCTGAWLRLRLPGGGRRAARDAWAVPPRSERALVALSLAPRAAPAPQRPLTAYVRIKADIPGGGLVVAVEARAVAPGEHARPLHVRLRARGTADPLHMVELEVANSADAEVSLEGGVRGAGCWRAAPPAAPCDAPAGAPAPLRHNGGTATGAHLTLLRAQLAPRQDFTPVARLTLNYAELWAQTSHGSRSEGAADGEAQEAWCGGCVRLGRAAVPFSVRLLPGALRLAPDRLDVVTAAEDAMREREVRARNEFRDPLRVNGLRLPPDVAEHFHVVDHTPLTLRAGASASLLHLRLRSPPPAAFALSSELTVYTNLSEYTVPVRIYSGKLIFEWEWPGAESSGASLELGALGASWTRRVGARVRNPAPVALCVRALGAALPGAAAGLALHPPPAEPDTKCIEAGGWAQAWLTVVAPAREGPLRGLVYVNTTLASTAAVLTLRVRAGHVRALPLELPPAAPYAGSSAELEVESTMSVWMRVTSLTARVADPALAFEWRGAGLGALGAGARRAARVRFAPERRCEPRCYTGLPLHSDEGAAWLRRSDAYDEAALRDDVSLLLARIALFQQQAPLDSNFTLYVHTTEVLQLVASGSAALRWPRLAARRAGAVPLAAVRRAAPLRLALRNVAHVPLLLHALLLPRRAPAALPAPAGGDSDFCTDEKCEWSHDAFHLTGWRVTRGAARLWNETREERGADEAGAHALPALLLEPHAEIEVSVTFAPQDTGSFTTYLYLRNNLTILEGVQLYGRGEYPSFDIAGRQPGSSAPFLFEVSECAWGGAGAVSRRVVARNAGRVGVSLSRWAVARGGCAARGFRVSPCAPLALPPNASAPLHLAFSPDYSLARVTATLQLHTDLGPAEYMLMATIPAKVLARCAATAPRPPWEGALRSAGVLLAFAAFAMVLAAAALDAERLLRRARAARSTSEPRAPLDLRGLAEQPPPTATPASRAPQRRRRSARRPLPPLDPRAERRAFERWRAEVLRREDESSRSSEDADLELDDDPPCAMTERSLAPSLEENFEMESHSPPIEPTDERDVEPSPIDEDGRSTGSETSTPTDDRDDADEPYGGDVEPDPRDDSPIEETDTAPASKPIVRPLVRTPPAESAPRAPRTRRDAADAQRRLERARHVDAGERRGTPARHLARKERAPKRRSERAPPTPPPRSPAAQAGGEAGEAGGEAGEARGGVRWGASWSSVVAARGASGAALAPIGSDVRRREPERAPDNSLFYFNGTTDGAGRPDAEFAWRPPITAERPAFSTPARDYLDETHARGVGGVGGVVGVGGVGGVGGVSGVGGVGGVGVGGAGGVGGVGGVGSNYGGVGLGSVWGGGWGAWGSGPLRPPPGFAPPSPPTQRSYDPFRSLASIWAPAPHDWGPATAGPSPPTPPRDRDDHI